MRKVKDLVKFLYFFFFFFFHCYTVVLHFKHLVTVTPYKYDGYV